MSNMIVYNQQERNTLMPVSIQDKLTMAKTLAESGLMPQALNTPQKVFVALQWGHELGLSPMVAVNNIAVINGKPTLGTDIMHALVRANPEYAGCEWKSMTAEQAEVVITRSGKAGKELYIGYFDMKMAHNAGITGKEVWKKYPQRMLKHRALSYALRDAFPDVLAGVYSPEELEDLANREPRNVSEPVGTGTMIAPTQDGANPEKRKKLLDEIGQIMKAESPDLLPYFTEAEKEREKELIKKLGPYEQGIKGLEEMKERLGLKLEERINTYKLYPLKSPWFRLWGKARRRKLQRVRTNSRRNTPGTSI